MSGLSGVALSKQPSKPNLNNCIICGQAKSSKQKLSNSAGARCKIIEASKKLKDGLLDLLNEVEIQQIQFHPTTCYGAYTLKASRFKESVPAPENDVEIDEGNADIAPRRPLTRLLIASPPSQARSSPLSKPCIICNHVSKDRIREKYRICEINRAKALLAAANFYKDDVFTRCSIYQKPGDVHAADIYAHKKCIRTYLSNFAKSTQQIMDSMEPDDDSNVQEAFKKLCDTLDLDSMGYEIAGCKKFVNGLLPPGEGISTKLLKKLLIKRYGNKICLTYSNDWTKPEMFYSTNIHSSRIVETIRSVDPIEECAKLLSQDCKAYDFGLDNSYCDADDLRISFESYEKNRPSVWTRFFMKMLDATVLSKKRQRVCDSIFQIMHSLLKENAINPLSASFSEGIHEASRSKHLVTIGNRLGFCDSYDSVQRRDTALAQRTIQRTGEYRVPVPSSINSTSIIHGAMDNFDKNDAKEGSHDTILMLFQNPSADEGINASVISTKDVSTERRLKTILPCQEILPANMKRRATISKNYVAAQDIDTVSEATSFSNYQTWLLLRFMTSLSISDSSIVKQYLPSFSAINSVLIKKNMILTREAYTPILPHPATDYDSINTIMINFQDVLKQKGADYGALWCDEGVYHIAKELQLLNPDVFKNIFLGLGGFHMEKNILTCCVQYLKFIGARDVFVQNEIFGPTVTDNKVMTGKDYKLCRQGMRLLSESVERLRFEMFFNENRMNFQEIVESVHDARNKPKSDDLFREKWNEVSEDLNARLFADFKKFVNEHKKDSDKWKYWSIFLDIFMPVVIDLTRSFREGDWNLHLSAVRRAIPLFFAFGHTNYSRWTPIYYEDCLNLPKNFPLLHSAFLKGDFVVQLTLRKSSSLPMDQALEMAYNKPAKGPGGVIGFTRRKEAVAKWNLIKHEKSKILSFLDDLCDLNENDEYSIHHEFSDKITESDEQDIESIRSFLFSSCDMFSCGSLSNVVTGIELPKEDAEYLLSCYEEGEVSYTTYRQKRLIDSSVKLFDRIPKPRIQKKIKQQPKLDLAAEKLTMVRTVDVARAQGYDVKKLLSYEVTSTSFFLMKEGFMRKAGKSELVKEFKENDLSYQMITESVDKYNKKITIIDFMAYARRLNSRIKKFNLKSYNDAMLNLWENFWKLGSHSDRIDIVFDLYKPDSVKASERKRRASDDAVRRKIDSLTQPLPKTSELDKYWASDENKKEFQQFFMKWVSESYLGDKPIYLGGCHPNGEEEKCYAISNGMKTLVPRLRSTHDEADDRIMIHINHAVKDESFECVLVNSQDSDIFVGLLYHLQKSWKEQGLKELWVENNENYAAIHDVCSNLSEDLIEMLPVVHTLTGCDTTSKVGTKKKALTVMKSRKHSELKDFGKNELDQQMLEAAETFLLKCMPKSSTVTSFDSLRHSMYHTQKLNLLDIEKLPCCSSTLQFHIKRAYRQCSSIKNCLVPVELPPEDYGFEFNEEDGYVPTITSTILPQDFPSPCTCGKCAKKNVCPCRVNGIKCSDFCRCKGDCKNPVK